jgi:hypothetical protein
MYYDVEDIRSHVAHMTGVEESRVQFSACIFSWRGAMSQKSYDSLLAMGLSLGQCEVLNVCQLDGSYHAYIAGSRSTLHQRKYVGNPTARVKGVTRTRDH